MKKIAKAIAAGCTTAVGGITTIYSDGEVTMPEPLIVLFTVIAAVAAVFYTKNSSDSTE